jgi:ABC-type phosphate transport system substrate-binding protein
MTILHRDENSGAENVFAKTLALDVSKFKGTSLNSTGVLVTQVGAATGTAIESSIGGANVAVLDQRRDEVRVLAYQHYGQTCGYYPDTSITAFDKRNIRDGHYPVWGVVHILTRVDGGLPVNPGANRFINLVLGTDELPGLDPIALEAEAGLIPQCAMTVARDEEGGPLTSVQPQKPCGCYFESLTGGTNCQDCTMASQCPTDRPKCSYGYCEP